jgi:hypothetical protein
MMPDTTAVENSRPETVRALHDLIEALDRRTPHVERAGESSIAQAAEALKLAALKRLDELQREASSI